jgi:hypothetical protein
MMASSYILHLPEEMETLLNQVAEASGMSSEAVLLDWLVHPVLRPTEDNLETLLEALIDYSDMHLWTVVYRNLEAKDLQGIEELNSKHEQGYTLSEAEKEEQLKLSDRVDDYMLLRSQALVHLKERGFDVSRYFSPERKYKLR